MDDHPDDYKLPVKPIYIDTETWKRDSHGLFDYETKDTIKNSLKITGSSELFRSGDNIELGAHKKDDSRRADVVLDVSFGDDNKLAQNQPDSSSEQNQQRNNDDGASSAEDFDENLATKVPNPLAVLVHKFGQYWLYNKLAYNKNEKFSQQDPINHIWFAIRDYQGSSSSQGYRIQEGDVLKFGRARMKIMKIHRTNESIPIPVNELECFEKRRSKPNKTHEVLETQDAEMDDDSQSCRICFMEAEDGNPLLSICKCSGSMKYIHQNCLRGWIDSRKTIQSKSHVISYIWKTYE